MAPIIYASIGFFAQVVRFVSFRSAPLAPPHLPVGPLHYTSMAVRTGEHTHGSPLSGFLGGKKLMRHYASRLA